jgi:hypothetical protein
MFVSRFSFSAWMGGPLAVIKQPYRQWGNLRTSLLFLFFLSALGAPPLLFAQPIASIELNAKLEVSASSNSWFDTGVDILAGTPFLMTASGRIGLSTAKVHGNVGPNGIKSEQRLRSCKFADALTLPAGALIAKIGDSGEPFVVGSSYEVSSSKTSGILFLAVNDPICARDNTGAFNVTIDYLFHREQALPTCGSENKSCYSSPAAIALGLAQLPYEGGIIELVRPRCAPSSMGAMQGCPHYWKQLNGENILNPTGLYRSKDDLAPSPVALNVKQTSSLQRTAPTDLRDSLLVHNQKSNPSSGRRDTIGLFEPSQATFHLRHKLMGGSADESFSFQNPATGSRIIPLLGDWDGNGTDSAGLYDIGASEFYLQNMRGSRADYVFRFGNSKTTLVPLSGDFDGDGRDSVALYEVATSTFYIINSLSPGGLRSADLKVSFGAPGSGWIPLAGDWDGDGMDTVGLYDPVKSKFHLQNRLSGGSAEIVFQFGSAGCGWVPLVGDWNGIGRDTIGLFDPTRSHFHLRGMLMGGDADVLFQFGAPSSGWLPLVGKFGGDGIGLHDPVAGEFHLKGARSSGPADSLLKFGAPVAASKLIPLIGDWNGDGTDSAGIYDPTLSEFHLQNRAGYNGDVVFRFGRPNSGWIPLVGDWNNDGIDTIGLYDPVSSTFHLKNIFSGGNADVWLQFGPVNSGWIPLAGDWNGDGRSTVGLYDPTKSAFHLKNTFTGAAADLVFTFGGPRSGWTPLVGDWNNDQRDSIGLFDPSTSLFHLKNSLSGGAADILFQYGPRSAGWIPLAGDFDGDGVHTVGLYDNKRATLEEKYDPTQSEFHLKNTLLPGNADLRFAFGWKEESFALSGDWNGDGIDTVALFDHTSAKFLLRYSSAGKDSEFTFQFGRPFTQPFSGDWDGDGSDGVGTYDRVTSTFSLKNTLGPGGPDIEVTIQGGWDAFGQPIKCEFAGDVCEYRAFSGDFNGDGRSDLGWYDPIHGYFYLILNDFSQGKQVFKRATSWVKVGPTLAEWRQNSAGNPDWPGLFPVIGDWDNDGKDDLGLYDPHLSKFLLRYSTSDSNELPVEFIFGNSPDHGYYPLAGRWSR